MLKTAGIISFDNLKFVEADLSKDKNWEKATYGCEYILHIASPIHLALPKHEDEMIRPAVDGTLRVLKAARDAGVKRVVMTSNFGAVGYSHKETSTLITEESWTDPNEKGLSAYNKSKILAERAAWDFIRKEGYNLELTVINPVAIFGPSLSNKLSSGFDLLKNIIDGTMKAIPNMELAIVDVRDLADIHIRAMENPNANGQRFLALSDGIMTLPEIANFLRKSKPEISDKISPKILPDWLVKVTALFNKKAKAIAPMLGVNRKASNAKAKNILGWQPRKKEDALLATVDSMIKYGTIKMTSHSSAIGNKLTMMLIFFSFSGMQQVFSQGTLQTIKGTVIDKETQLALKGVSVTLLGANQSGTATDTLGRFTIPNVPPGRYDVSFSIVGYTNYLAPNVEVTSGKEVILDIGLENGATSLQEVVIKVGSKKHETVNQLATVSGRSFTMEEVNRYSGGRSDPSRLAANFAGVSAPNDARNDIVVRGNSPTGVLWRIEGLNIPNPNHFASLGTTGGAASALNTNILKNSDFLTSAFPAEYGNANAGVFDLGFRTGNTDKWEHTIQLGALTGLEAMTEGPINKEKGSSYVLAYRYSFTGLAQNLGLTVGTASTPFYQDLSFKINSGNGKLGRFTLFGLGGTSSIDILHDKVEPDDIFGNPKRDFYNRSRIGLIGLKHNIRVSSKSYFNTVIGATYSRTEQTVDSISVNVNPPVVEVNSTQARYSINTSFNTTISPKFFLKIGAIEELINVNLFYRDRISPPNDWKQIWDFNGNTSLLQGYVHARYKVTDKLTANIGLHSQYMSLNGSASLEPRAAFKYQMTEKNTMTLGFGLHSQMQPADAYFYQVTNSNGSIDRSNEELDFTRSQHYVLGYEILPFNDWRIKAEVYYQYLDNVPVSINPSSFSMLNAGSRDYYYNEHGNLKNDGTGYNYGAELTIEKFFSNGYYGLFTGSIYQSRYTGSDEIERNTGFNGRYVYNILAGREWKIGISQRNKFSVDMKLTQAGGRYYTPVDYPASVANNREILKGDAFTLSERNKDFFRLDVKAGFTFNSGKRNLSQSVFLDIQNVTDNKNVLVGERYNPGTQIIGTAYQIGLFPNFVYRLQL